MPKATPKLAIIAALEREVAPLVKGWNTTSVHSQRRTIKIFERENVIVACGGIGGISARIATDAVWRHSNGNIEKFISAGFAGALVPELKVGDIFEPAIIIGDSDNNTIETAAGKGKLVSAGAIAGVEHKRIFAGNYEAQAVDMEAYAVADVARVYNVPCIAIKVISDEYDFPMPPMGRFVGDSGEFKTAGFIAYTVVRPWLWPTVIKLGSNSALATERLCAALKRKIEQYSKVKVEGFEANVSRS
ncbi:MAG: putative phosphorylase, family 1 [Acidobacteriaceae bacterium]|nr:putative phosphorylase, family 1 [Acidobacteriaceae bacterium]